MYSYWLALFTGIILNKIIKIIINSQITKAHDYIFNHISINLFNSSFTILWQYVIKNLIMSVRWKVYTISKQVGISEAIRLILILIFFKLNLSFNLNSIFNLINSINYNGFSPFPQKINLFRYYKHSTSNNNNDNYQQKKN